MKSLRDSGDSGGLVVNLFPWTAALCAAFAAFEAVFFLVAYCAGGVTEAWAKDTSEVRSHSATAVMLVFSAFVLEAGFLWTGLMFGRTKDVMLKHQMTNHRILDSVLTLLEYTIKFLTGITIWKLPSPVHTDIWAIGEHRPVYFVRFAQWSVAVPILILISNRAFLAELGARATIQRTLPAMLVTHFSVWLAWQMEVTPVFSWRWPCMTVSTFGLVFAQMDQIALCRQCRHVQNYNMKFGMVSYQITTFAFYACVFMAGRWGLLSPSLEQYIYAYCDSTVKVLQGAILALIRGCEDAQTIHRWYAEAIAYKKDFEAILKVAHVPIFFFNMDGSITRINESGSDILGLSSDQDVVGTDIRKLVVENNRQSFNRALEKIQKDEWRSCSGLVEVTFRCKEGSNKEAYFLLNLVPLDVQDGGAKSIVAIGQDLTELAELKSVEEKKNRLMAVVSHELRSPLHGMIGLTSGMMDVVKLEGLKRQLGMVRSCAVRLLDLVTNIMDLSEAEKRKGAPGSCNVPKQKVNFLAVVEEIIVMSRHAVDKANKPLIKPDVELRNELRRMDKVPLVLGNPYKCTQLIYNLVTNACKFTKEGYVSVCGRHLKDKSLLEVSVQDTGRGISAEAKDRVFRPFEQEHSDSGDSRNFQGMGLGLAVCMEIVQMHGGSIRVESTLGKGSSFIVSLTCLNDEFCEPVIEVPAKIETEGTMVSAPTPTAPKPTLPAPKPTAMRQRDRPLILSVDDDEINQEVIKTVFSCDYEVVCCMDGPSALSWLEGQYQEKEPLPDVILLDIQMPGMTGYEVCKKIRQHVAHSISGVPVMMLSANASKIAALKSTESGSSGFVAKPFAKEQLLRRVQEAMEKRKEAQKEEESQASIPPTMPRQSTEDLSMDVLGARANLLEVEKNEAQESALRASSRVRELEKELRGQAVELGQLKLRLAQADPVHSPAGSSHKVPLLGDAHLSEVEFLHSELAQRDVEIVRLHSQLGVCRASNQLIARRLQMQNRLNQMLHDVLTDTDSLSAVDGPGEAATAEPLQH